MIRMLLPIVLAPFSRGFADTVRGGGDTYRFPEAGCRIKAVQLFDPLPTGPPFRESDIAGMLAGCGFFFLDSTSSGLFK